MAIARPEEAEAISLESDDESLTGALLYHRHFQDVVRWVSHLAGPDPEVEDLAQEVFVIACRRLGGFRGEGESVHLALRDRAQRRPQSSAPDEDP